MNQLDIIFNLAFVKTFRNPVHKVVNLGGEYSFWRTPQIASTRFEYAWNRLPDENRQNLRLHFIDASKQNIADLIKDWAYLLCKGTRQSWRRIREYLFWLKYSFNNESVFCWLRCSEICKLLHLVVSTWSGTSLKSNKETLLLVEFFIAHIYSTSHLEIFGCPCEARLKLSCRLPSGNWNSFITLEVTAYWQV